MRVLLDTNILLDVLLERQPFADNSAKIWSAIHDKKFGGWVSAISINNIYYITKKLNSKKTARGFVSTILKHFNIVPLSKTILHRSTRPVSLDFEDVIQYRSAEFARCEYLISRDQNKFPRGKVKVVTPEEFIRKYSA